MTLEELFNYLRSHKIYEDCVVKIRLSSRITKEELSTTNIILYYDEEDDDFYWFDDFTFNKDIMDCEILGFSTLREIEIPIINI